MAARRNSSIRKGQPLTAQTRVRKAPKGKRTIIGIGQFDSGVPDLATNKKHMEGYGLSRSESHRRQSD